MSLEDFLDAQSDIREKEFQMLCSYCETCYEFNENYCCDEDNYFTHSDDCGDYDDSCSAHYSSWKTSYDAYSRIKREIMSWRIIL